MLEKAIEIEGLLRIIRDGEPLPETYKLLTDKIEHLASEATILAAEATQQTSSDEERSIEETLAADFIMAPPEETPVTPKVDFTAPEQPKENPLSIQGEPTDETLSNAPEQIELDLDLEEEDDIILSFDDAPLSPAVDTELPTTSEDIISGDPIAEKGTIETEATHPDRQSEKVESRKQIKLRSAFSLNDRFLYARELFNGNMKMFDATLDSLEGITDFSVIEDYFYNELGWNPEDPNVASFMERLKIKG